MPAVSCLIRAGAVMAAVLATVLSGCSPSGEGTQLFPLEAGRQWTYRQTSEWENGTRDEETVVLRNEGRDSSLASGAAWRRRSETGLDYWLRADATGVYRVAAKSDADPEPKPDEKPRYVLKAPMSVGTEWQADTNSYLLRRRSDFPPEIRHSHAPVIMVYRVDALDQKVQTPAGNFEHCLRVKGEAKMKLFADPVVGWQDMPLVTREWYCPGVGLVRVERDEPANSTFLLGGTVKLELLQWQ